MFKQVVSRGVAMRLAARSLSSFKTIGSRPALLNNLLPAASSSIQLSHRCARLDPSTFTEIEGRVMNVLKSFDKIDPTKLTMESHFIKDIGLDSLDHVECIIFIENEFMLEIDDAVSETLMTPREICDHLADRWDVQVA